MSRRLTVEADGGSRGNPGVAGYGAQVRDTDTGALLAERAEPLGKESNNVAEYRGLIAGLEAAFAVDPAAEVLTVAVMGGSGDDRFDDVRASGADVYVTADLRHHPALEAREEARGGTPYLVDAGHWASEQVWLAPAERALRAALGERATRVETHISTVRTDPWTFVVGADPGGMT